MILTAVRHEVNNLEESSVVVQELELAINHVWYVSYLLCLCLHAKFQEKNIDNCEI